MNTDPPTQAKVNAPASGAPIGSAALAGHRNRSFTAEPVEIEEEEEVEQEQLISKPLNSLERVGTANERSLAFQQFRVSTDPWLGRLRAQGVDVQPEIWSVEQPYSREDAYPEKRVYVAGKIDRLVAGDLSKIYLRVMREFGVKHMVPFDFIQETDHRFVSPDELTLIAEKLQAYALGDSSIIGLTSAEESLLFHRYIHFSANWNAVNNWKSSDLDVVFINRPADDYRRISHANE